MDLAQEVSRQIKAARESRGWTQEELAKQCGVKKAQISKIERDIRHASTGLFIRVCEVFDFNIHLLDKSILEILAEENVTKYITELGKPVEERDLSSIELGKALDSVTRFTLAKLSIDYSYGKQEYDYRFNINNKIILLAWKIGNLKNIEYRNNCLSEVKRAFEDTHAHEFIVAIPDYPDIAVEMNSNRYIDNLVFVPINSLQNHLKYILENENS
jgi:transcriptional regulator with XRE-family HTH domain